MSALQIGYLNLENPVRHTDRETNFQSRCSHCGGSQPTEELFKQQRKDKGHNKLPLNSRNSNNKCT